ncbi:HD-GYP domain, c-di-GMP phosphodiesterase class II (or its inactivated variant) [Malonomonas rubra DSM 5091]|uniref:HD-GYP domain, c-di-GMP phosphodiesterase class II (Or its inactivated variant) n=1 Tax=Malonomonas rubra DSM 5091 TaxID=1122189 RepID=A0A1M6G4V0_MALRU|nr:HD domain-containing phosphohydrolase [Malonomonas rubra]SHJ04999.1 HD-GYP domain, c-di-GMP phosphodiesterase class II (or its inactivated variant) [Malonomonas rubra DSM 5091]
MKYLPQLKSRVSRRIFLAVLLCALVPISGLILLTLQSVRANLEADTARRLHHAGKNIGMAVVTEFVSVESALKKIASLYDVPGNGLELEENFGEALLEKFWLQPAGAHFPIAGLNFSEEYKDRLASGSSQLVLARVNQAITLYLCIPTTDAHSKPVIAVGKISLPALEEYALNFLPLNAQLILLDADWQPLTGNLSNMLAPDQFHKKGESGHSYAEIHQAGETWLAGRWSLFLKAAFNTSNWNILVLEPKAEIFSSLAHFGRNAWLTSAMAFWVILLTSSILVRKTLQPLQQLKEATREIGQGHFNCQVRLDSRDEFEELSTSFNQMTTKIQQQVQQQQDMGQAVRQILGAIDMEAIIVNFLRNIRVFESISTLSLTLYNEMEQNSSATWLSSRTEKSGIELLSNAVIAADEVELLLHEKEACSVPQWRFPTLLQPLAERGGKLFSLLLIEYKPSMHAIVGLSHASEQAEQSDLLIARQLADQLRVALSRAEMVKELDDLNLGILTALARTVDANSQWTHGHSERVTEYAFQIAKAMGQDESACLDLHQAGLLHDLGKVAVPAEILNKPGKLTDEEFEIIKRHPVEAVRIIEPIQVFGKILPIVRQHHERWDGTGYPDGLKGTEIHLGARILAVADVYDALYSERPYRASWNQEKVLAYLQGQAGKAFDPEVVNAFCTLVQQDDRWRNCS